VELDNETVAAFVKRELSQNILNYVAGPLISTLFYYGSQETSILLYLNLARHMRNTRLYTVRGGIARIAKEAAQRCGVRLNEPVTRIDGHDSEYLVNGERFSHVVCAIPGNAVLGIPGMPELLADEDRQFLARCAYGRALTVSFATPTPLGRCYALSIPRVEKLRAATIEFHDFIAPDTFSERGRVTIVGGEDVQADDLLQDFQRIYPGMLGYPEIQEWKAALPKFPPGRYRELSGFLARKRRPGLLFCGDYLLGPFIEGAVTTGRRAAEAVANY
jgi:protoporphyrinogen oxidase